jgi:hypothetical protein
MVLAKLFLGAPQRGSARSLFPAPDIENRILEQKEV